MVDEGRSGCVAVMGAPAVFESNSQAVVNNTQDNIAEQPCHLRAKWLCTLMIFLCTGLYYLDVNFCSRMLKHLENGLTITLTFNPSKSKAIVFSRQTPCSSPFLLFTKWMEIVDSVKSLDLS